MTITYGGNGRWFEVTRGGPPEVLAGVIPELAKGTASAVELLAGHVAGLDLARHGPGRAYLPVPMPAGARGVFAGGLRAIRECLFSGSIPWTARHVAADGLTGRALAWGPTREAALAAWSVEVERVSPWPVPSPEPPAPLPAESIESHVTPDGFSIRATLRGPPSDVPMPEPRPDHTPAALVETSDPPATPPPVGRWVRLVTSGGEVVHAALRDDPDGFTLLGDRLLAVIDSDDLASLDALLDEAERGEPVFPPPPPGFAAEMPPFDFTLRRFQLFDERTGARLPLRPPSRECGGGFSAARLDGGRLRWCAARLRRGRP